MLFYYSFISTSCQGKVSKFVEVLKLLKQTKLLKLYRNILKSELRNFKATNTTINYAGERVFIALVYAEVKLSAKNNVTQKHQEFISTATLTDRTAHTSK